MKSHNADNQFNPSQANIYGIDFSISSFNEIKKQILKESLSLNCDQEFIMNIEVIEDKIKYFFAGVNEYTLIDRLNFLDFIINNINKISYNKMSTNAHKKLIMFCDRVKEEKYTLEKKKTETENNHEILSLSDKIDLRTDLMNKNQVLDISKIYELGIKRYDINNLKISAIRNIMNRYEDRKNILDHIISILGMEQEFIKQLKAFVEKYGNEEALDKNKLIELIIILSGDTSTSNEKIYLQLMDDFEEYLCSKESVFSIIRCMNMIYENNLLTYSRCDVILSLYNNFKSVFDVSMAEINSQLMELSCELSGISWLSMRMGEKSSGMTGLIFNFLILGDMHLWANECKDVLREGSSHRERWLKDSNYSYTSSRFDSVTKDVRETIMLLHNNDSFNEANASFFLKDLVSDKYFTRILDLLTDSNLRKFTIIWRDDTNKNEILNHIKYNATLAIKTPSDVFIYKKHNFKIFSKKLNQHEVFQLDNYIGTDRHSELYFYGNAAKKAHAICGFSSSQILNQKTFDLLDVRRKSNVYNKEDEYRYDLDLISSLPGKEKRKAEEYKIYLSKKGKYIIRGLKFVIHKGYLDANFDLSDLENKLYDSQFKNRIFSILSTKGYIHKYHDLNFLNGILRLGYNGIWNESIVLFQCIFKDEKSNSHDVSACFKLLNKLHKNNVLTPFIISLLEKRYKDLKEISDCICKLDQYSYCNEENVNTLLMCEGSYTAIANNIIADNLEEASKHNHETVLGIMPKDAWTNYFMFFGKNAQTSGALRSSCKHLNFYGETADVIKLKYHK